MPDPRRADISMHHIPIKGGIGVGVLIAMLVTWMLIDLPQLRWPVLGSIALGVVFGVALIVWRLRAETAGGS